MLDDDNEPVTSDAPLEVTVDGEVFRVTVRPGAPFTIDYDWVSGRNANYGFSSTQHVAYGSVQDRASYPTVEPYRHTVDEHRESIRDFLRNINPETGYLGD